MKKSLVLLVLFLALLTFVYFYEIEGESDRARSRELEESLLRLGDREVISVVIARPGQPDISLGREGEGWVLWSPLEVNADASAIDALTRALESASRVRTLSDGAARAQEYGLAPPRLRLAVQATGEARTVLLGGDDYSGENVYVQLEGEGDVFLTEKALLAAADKDLLAWRSRKLLNFDRDQITTIELDNTGGLIRLAKLEEDWFLEAPLEELADSNAVQDLLAALEFGEVQEFVAEEPAGLDAFGLEVPVASVRLGFNQGSSWKSLQLGDRQGANYLARDPDRSAVFSVETKIFDQLSSTVWKFRDKDVVNVPQDQILELRLVRGEEELQLQYEDFTWTILKPESHRDQEALSYKFWYPINDIRFRSIQDEPWDPTIFSQPEVVIELTLKDGTTRTFDFVQGDGRYLARRTESGRQGLISEQDFQKLQFHVEDIL